jgi:6-phosphofructokinase 1
MNALVAHSGGPTAVINASLAGVVEEARRQPAITRLYGARFGIEGMLGGDFTDLLALDASTLAAVARTSASALGTSRRTATDADIDRVLAQYRAGDIRALFYTGGNGSMGTAHQLAQGARSAGQELLVVGVPKTIDNDLAATDHSPGFPSAARFFASAARDLGADNRALPGLVQVLEVLGRHAGWLTAATTLARTDPDDPPHLVYMPERPLALTTLLDDVRRVFDRLNRCLVVVCEGQLDEHGEPFGADVRMSSRGPLATNLAHRLAFLITDRLGLKARGEKPGLVGRASADLRSTVDFEEAWQCGIAAVRAACSGASDVMVTLERQPGPMYSSATGLVRLDAVAGVERKFPAEWISESGHDIEPGYGTYAAPLVGHLDRNVSLVSVTPGRGRD